jgi:hypothetical protein
MMTRDAWGINGSHQRVTTWRENISHFISFHFTSSWLNDSVFYDRLRGVRDRAERRSCSFGFWTASL